MSYIIMEREITTRRGRPRVIRDGQKLNLYVSRRVKQTIRNLARAHGKSMSAVVSDAVLARPQADENSFHQATELIHPEDLKG